MATRTQHVPAAIASGADPAYQAYRILHVAFIVAPVVAGLDKFVHLLVDWTQYLWPAVPNALGVSPGAFMAAVGVVEVIAGVLVAVRPRIGGYVVAGWLVGIILNLLLLGAYFDVALRDLGLALGALSLARLATAYARAGAS